MHHVDRRDADQEIQVTRRQVIKQPANQLGTAYIVVGKHIVDGDAGIAAALCRRDGELHTEGPALRQFVQAGAGIGVDRRSEAVADEGDGLVEPEAQHLRANRHAQAIGRQIGNSFMKSAAAGEDNAQVGRQVVQKIDERLQVVPGEPVSLVDDEHHVERCLGDFGKPLRDAPDVPKRRARPLEQGATEIRPAAANAHGQCQPV